MPKTYYIDTRNAACDAVHRITSRPSGVLTATEEKIVLRVMSWLDQSLTVTEAMRADVEQIADKYNPEKLRGNQNA